MAADGSCLLPVHFLTHGLLHRPIMRRRTKFQQNRANVGTVESLRLDTFSRWPPYAILDSHFCTLDNPRMLWWNERAFKLLQFKYFVDLAGKSLSVARRIVPYFVTMQALIPGVLRRLGTSS